MKGSERSGQAPLATAGTITIKQNGDFTAAIYTVQTTLHKPAEDRSAISKQTGHQLSASALLIAAAAADRFKKQVMVTDSQQTVKEIIQPGAGGRARLCVCLCV